VTYEQWDQRAVPDAALAALVSIRHWSRLEELAQFAAERHGFGDSNGGFGITYPTDVDEYDREVDKITIPDGHVLAYGFWGASGPHGGYDVLVPEALYLSVLVGELSRSENQKTSEVFRQAGWRFGK
jgi:attachment invasion locus protein